MSGGGLGMRTSSDSFPIVLALAAFVLMFLGQSTYQMLVEGWLVRQVTPWLGGIEAQVVERLTAVAVAGTLSLYVTGALYFYLRREFARQFAPPAGASRAGDPPEPADASTARRARVEPQRDVWLHDAICRIFLGRWEPIALKRGKLDLDGADGEVLRDLVTRHIRQLAAEGALPIWGRRRGYWALWELAPPAFWKHHQVDYQSFLEADPKLLHALPCNSANSGVAIGQLMTSKAAVEAFCESVAL
jgi:hypothetical protein